MLSEMLGRCGIKRIEQWLNTRILEPRQKIDQLRRYFLTPGDHVFGRKST
jgi:hypothetical protein